MAPHYFIGHIEPGTEYSAGDYERDAIALLDQLFEQHSIVIAVGGAGLYLKALCEGIDELPKASQEREQVEKEYQAKGLPWLQAWLQNLDPVYYEQVDQQNPHRLIRAVSVCLAAGVPFSTLRTGKPKPRNFTPIHLQMHLPRTQLYQRIDERVDAMVEAGLENEVRQLLPLRHHNSLQTVGYQEWFPYFDGEYTREEAIERIKQYSRNYAKRQLTWLRRDGYWKRLSPFEPDTLIQYVEYLRQNPSNRIAYTSVNDVQYRLHWGQTPEQYLTLTKRGKQWAMDDAALPDKTRTDNQWLLQEASLCLEEWQTL